MYEIHQLSWEDAESLQAKLEAAVPIEQTRSWAEYQATIDGRTPWGVLSITYEDKPVALVSLIDYETHGYHYLRSHHGPVWFAKPTEPEEHDVLRSLASFVRRRDRHQLFMRLAVEYDLYMCHPTLSGIPYDTTVMVDVTGGDEAILSRMKPRGRRDVRKALREAPVTCADETDRALLSFAEYYPVMVDTARRDGFHPAPQTDFEHMLSCLGPEHTRLLAARRADNTVCAWSLCTVSGTMGTRYYAASATDVMRLHVADRLCYFECCELGRIGCTAYDLMAVGSEFSPQLMGLNEFKGKYAKELTQVAPDRDVPVRRAPYRALQLAKRARQALRDRR